MGEETIVAPQLYNSKACVYPMPLVQFLLTWKLLQHLGSSLMVLPKQNSRNATCWAFYSVTPGTRKVLIATE
ncbi:unnamed protein product, partial [Vitis vinifera]|uniref:Uncharacterized protein n=1 Tax=Vitis vinifera TaxID=29760 RepID=D7TP25_VITVI